MDEAGNNAKKIVKGVLKAFTAKISIVVVIFVLILGLVPMLYTMSKEDFDKLNEKTNTYATQVDTNGQVVYVKKDEQGNGIPVTEEEIAKDLAGTLKDYIEGDEEEKAQKIKYLMNAEAVTKMPYIENSSDDDSLTGQIKFYRFDSEKDASNAYETDSEGNKTIKDSYRLTYVAPATFESQKQNYESTGSEEIFKHFTIDSENNVLIAYGRKEVRTITTGDPTNAADSELTLETIKEISGEAGYSGNYNSGFSMVNYTVFEKKIDYLSLVEQYVMPTNLLYSLLIQTKDIDFVEAIAGLAYGNQIAIGIYDNESESNTDETYTYKKLLEMNLTTKLDFSKLNTSEPDMPAIKPQDLNKDLYSNIPHKCEVVTDNGRATHKMYYFRTSDGSTQSASTDDGFYIKALNTSGKVTSLTTEDDAQQFIVKYNQKVNSKSTPTIGIMLADTWIARWEATYNKQEAEPTSSYSSSQVEDTLIKEYSTTGEVLSAFEEEIKNTISQELVTHGENLISSAIDRIVECTDFSVQVSAGKITAEDITDEIKKNLLSEHKETCSECKAKINSWWAIKNRNNDDRLLFSDIDYSDNNRKLAALEISKPMLPTLPVLLPPTLQDIYWAVTKGELKGSIVETHLNDEINSYIEEKNAEAEEDAQKDSEERKAERKENFKKTIEEQITYAQKLTGEKSYVDMENAYSYTKTSSEYKKSETLETTKIGEKFSKIFKDQKFYDARQAILQRKEWLWEYIRENDDTAKLENILRYLLNIATESNAYGTFTEEEIKDLFKTFEPKEQMETTSDSGMNLLQQYVRMYENSYIFDYVYGKSDNYTELVSQYITEDRTAYYVRSDGHDHPTVGFGVDLFNGGCYDEDLGNVSFATYLIEKYEYTEEQLKDMSGATTIPTEIVDELEAKELQACVDDIRQMNKQENLELKKYQIYALASLSFNSGKRYNKGSYDDFIELYRDNWNEEVDSKYGEILGNMDHVLYKEIFYKVRFSNGKEVPGLINRRKSEWTLFQTGYMDVLDKWVSERDYPDGIRTFIIEGTGLTFPEYPQTESAGEQYKLYADKPIGGATKAYAGKTLQTSGCGIFSSSCIVSGLLSDESIDPITYTENLDEYFPNGNYYSVNGGGTREIFNNDFLKKYYGLNSGHIGVSDAKMKQIFEEKGGMCGAVALQPGHYVAIVPIINENGKCEQFQVIDSTGINTGVYSSISDYISKSGKESLYICAIIY